MKLKQISFPLVVVEFWLGEPGHRCLDYSVSYDHDHVAQGLRSIAEIQQMRRAGKRDYLMIERDGVFTIDVPA